MTPFDYLESRADAGELIQEFGQPASVRRITNSGPPWEPVQTVTDYPTFAARVAFTLTQIQTRNVQATDQRWLVAAGPLAAPGIEPTPADKLVIAGLPIEIVQVDALNPAGTAVLFDCQVRI
jgi:hypothetical protein